MEVLGSVVAWIGIGCSVVFCRHDTEFAWGLTAAHCVKAVGQELECRYDGRRFMCRVAGIDRENDLAVVYCFRQHVGPVSCPIVASSEGDVVLVGYPRGKLSQVDGKMTSKLAETSPGEFRAVVTTSEPIYGGFSGGGVFSRTGLVAIVTHSLDRGSKSDKITARRVFDETSAGCSILDRFVDRQSDRFVDRAENRLQTQAGDQLQIHWRDVISLVLGWLVRFWIPGSNMLTHAKHTELLNAARPRP